MKQSVKTGDLLIWQNRDKTKIVFYVFIKLDEEHYEVHTINGKVWYCTDRDIEGFENNDVGCRFILREQ